MEKEYRAQICRGRCQQLLPVFAGPSQRGLVRMNSPGSPGRNEFYQCEKTRSLELALPHPKSLLVGIDGGFGIPKKHTRLHPFSETTRGYRVSTPHTVFIERQIQVNHIVWVPGQPITFFGADDVVRRSEDGTLLDSIRIVADSLKGSDLGHVWRMPKFGRGIK